MTALKKLSKYFSPVYDESVEVGESGVLRVDVNRLLSKASVKQQLQAVDRLRRAAARHQRKAG